MKGEPKLVASFADAPRFSIAAAVYNAAFAAAGLDWSFVPFRADAATLARLFARLRADNLAAADFAPSCQEAALALCDELSAEAELLKAVTTARIRDGRMEGFNVGVRAFERTLEEADVAVADEPVLILGVGATARACGLALERAGAHVTYATDELTRPRPGLSSLVTVIRTDDVGLYLTGKQPALLVNATAYVPDEAAPVSFDYDVIPPTCFVYELTYGDRSPLLDAAEERGLPHADGLSMLLHAADLAFTLWTGAEAPREVMRRAAESELSKRNL
jgi:shikimate dehydrogenase